MSARLPTIATLGVPLLSARFVGAQVSETVSLGTDATAFPSGSSTVEVRPCDVSGGRVASAVVPTLALAFASRHPGAERGRIGLP